MLFFESLFLVCLSQVQQGFVQCFLLQGLLELDLFPLGLFFIRLQLILQLLLVNLLELVRQLLADFLVVVVLPRKGLDDISHVVVLSPAEGNAAANHDLIPRDAEVLLIVHQKLRCVVRIPLVLLVVVGVIDFHCNGFVHCAVLDHGAIELSSA